MEVAWTFTFSLTENEILKYQMTVLQRNNLLWEEKLCPAFYGVTALNSASINN